MLIDPEISLTDRYVALATRGGLRIQYLIDTHTPADHFSGTQQLARKLGVPVAMHRASPAPFVDLRLDDGDMLAAGKLRLQVLHTPGHTRDSMCLLVDDRLFTGDTLPAPPVAPICRAEIRMRFPATPTIPKSGYPKTYSRRFNSLPNKHRFSQPIKTQYIKPASIHRIET